MAPAARLLTLPMRALDPWTRVGASKRPGLQIGHDQVLLGAPRVLHDVIDQGHPGCTASLWLLPANLAAWSADVPLLAAARLGRAGFLRRGRTRCTRRPVGAPGILRGLHTDRRCRTEPHPERGVRRPEAQVSADYTSRWPTRETCDEYTEPPGGGGDRGSGQPPPSRLQGWPGSGKTAPDGAKPGKPSARAMALAPVRRSGCSPWHGPRRCLGFRQINPGPAPAQRNKSTAVAYPTSARGTGLAAHGAGTPPSTRCCCATTRLTRAVPGRPRPTAGPGRAAWIWPNALVMPFVRGAGLRRRPGPEYFLQVAARIGDQPQRLDSSHRAPTLSALAVSSRYAAALERAGRAVPLRWTAPAGLHRRFARHAVSSNVGAWACAPARQDRLQRRGRTGLFASKLAAYQVLPWSPASLLTDHR